MGKHQDRYYVGKMVGKFKILRWSHQVGKISYYEVECPLGHIYVTSYRVICLEGGCRNCNKGPRNKQWKGYGELSGELFKKYKRNAEDRGIDFSVTIEEAWDIFLKQNKKCALTGIPLIIVHGNKDFAKCNLSLDRIDSKLGYSKNNIQWVHKAVNLIKRHYPNELFILIANLISKSNSRLDIDTDQVNEQLNEYSCLCKPKVGSEHHRSKKVIIETPEGEKIEVNGLEDFCNKNNLSPDSLRRTLKCNSFYKGYRLIKIHD